MALPPEFSFPFFFFFLLYYTHYQRDSVDLTCGGGHIHNAGASEQSAASASEV
jgi:hypothetical protein